MNKRFALGVAFFLSFLNPDTSFSQLPGLKLTNEKATAVERRFGTVQANDFLAGMARFQSQGRDSLISLGYPDHRLSLPIPSRRYEPKPLYVGSPLIQTKGIVQVGNNLYISDTGKDGVHNEKPKIWRFNLETNQLSTFYSGDLLVTSKWLAYSPGNGEFGPEIIISDLGVEPTPRLPGTGEGAKVFALPLRPDGTAGAPRMIFAGPPLRSPEGIAVVGSDIILADWAAGESATRPELPDVTYRKGAVFQIPLRGGTPARLFPDHNWVILIGVDAFEVNGKAFVEFIDIGSGRLDQSGRSPLPYEGTPEVFRARVASKDPLVLAALERVVVSEDSIVSLDVPTLSANQHLTVSLLDGARFDDEAIFKIFAAKEISDTGGIASLLVRSDTSRPKIKLEARITEGDSVVAAKVLESEKVLLWGSPVAHPKRDSSIQWSPDTPAMKVGADGTTGSVFMFPFGGGTPGIVWRGKPFSQPIGTQASPDNKRLYVTDQAAGPNETSGIFFVETPSQAEISRMFPHARAAN